MKSSREAYRILKRCGFLFDYKTKRIFLPYPEFRSKEAMNAVKYLKQRNFQVYEGRK